MKSRNRTIFLLIAFILSLSAFFLSAYLESFKDFGYLSVFIFNLIGASTLFLPTPSFIFVIAASAFLNPILVAFFSALGATIGELTGYMAGLGGEELVEKSKWHKNIKKWMDKNGPLTLFLLAAIPNPFFDVAGIIAGAAQISVRKYMLVVFCGKFVKFMILALIGNRTSFFFDGIFSRF